MSWLGHLPCQTKFYFASCLATRTSITPQSGHQSKHYNLLSLTILNMGYITSNHLQELTKTWAHHIHVSCCNLTNHGNIWYQLKHLALPTSKLWPYNIFTLHQIIILKSSCSQTMSLGMICHTTCKHQNIIINSGNNLGLIIPGLLSVKDN